jgi:hypothetical protein
LWIFALPTTQKSRLSGILTQFAGKKIALQSIFRDFMREAQQTARTSALLSKQREIAKMLR